MGIEIQDTCAKSHISKINERFKANEALLTTLANLSNTVIETALSGQNKFLFELLQNADDSPKIENDSIEINFTLDDNYLFISHTGQDFDKNDVERVCDYASLIKEVKSNDLSKTGYKGLGFKSLFNLTDCIYIVSNGYSFRFDKNYWEEPEKRPWQIIPIWTLDEYLPLKEKYEYKNPVTIVLKLKDKREIANHFEEIKNKPEILMFLHYIDVVTVKLDKSSFNLRREKTLNAHANFDAMTLSVDNQMRSKLLLKSYEYAVPSELRKSISDGSHFIFPDKIKNAETITFSFAIELDKPYKTIQTVSGISFVTIPTQVSLGFPYHINSSFILTLDRTQFHENAWNDFLFECFGYSQLQLLRDLANTPQLKYEVVLLFRESLKHPYSHFVNSYNNGFNKARKSIAWLPAYMNSELLKLDEACVDTIDFFKKFNVNDPLIRSSIISYEVVNAHVLYQKKLSKEFNFESLLKNLEKNYLPQLYPKDYKSFICYFWRNGQNQNRNTVNRIKSNRFLVTKAGLFVSPQAAQIEAESNLIPNFLEFDPINKEILPLDEHGFENWLINLGVKKLTIVQVIRERIIPWIVSNNAKVYSHHLEIIKYIALANHYDRRMLIENGENYLKKLPVMTQSKQFRQAFNCYLSDPEDMEELIGLISNNELVDSEVYSEDEKKLLVKLGVKKLTLPLVIRDKIIPWVCCNDANLYTYHLEIIKCIASADGYAWQMLSENEKIRLKKLSVMTKSKQLKQALECYLSGPEDPKELLSLISDSELIDHKVYSEKEKEFLLNLGVKKLALAQVIKEKIIPWIRFNDANLCTHYKEIIKCIASADHYDLRVLTKDEKDYLKKLPVMTKSKQFKQAFVCYLSEREHPKELINLISDNELIEPEVYSEKEKEFLLSLGAKKLTLSQVIKEKIIPWIRDNHATLRTHHMEIIKCLASADNFDWKILTKDEKDCLNKLPIMTTSKQYKKVCDCYLSVTGHSKELISLISDNEFVDPEVYSEEEMKFLSNLEMKKLTLTQVIKEKIIPWILNDDANLCSHHTNIIKYIASANHDDWQMLNDNEKDTLKKLPIITKSEKLREACDCYLTNSEHPKELVNIIPNDELVDSEKYSVMEKKFLLNLGVKTELTLKTLYRQLISRLKDGYYAKFFWKSLIEYWNKHSNDSSSDVLLCYVQSCLKSNAYIMGNDEKLHKSIDLYVTDFKLFSKVDVNVFPLVRKGTFLPNKLENYLGFKSILTVNTLLNLFKSLQDKPINASAILFKKILEQMKLINFDYKQVGEKNEILLLTENNTLQPASGLTYFQEEDADFPKKSSFYLKRITGMSHEETIELAKRCGVNIMPHKVQLVTPKSMPDESLKEFMLDKLILVTLQETEKRNMARSILLRELYNEIQKIKLFKCEKLTIKYPFEDSATPVTCHFNGLEIFVAGEWRRPQAKIEIFDKIRSELKVSTDLRVIFELNESEDVQEWLDKNEHKLDNYMDLKKELQFLNENYAIGLNDELLIDENSEEDFDSDIHNSEEFEENTCEKQASVASDISINLVDKNDNIPDNIIEQKRRYKNSNRRRINSTRKHNSKELALLSTPQTMNMNNDIVSLNQYERELTDYQILTLENEVTLSKLMPSSMQTFEYEKLSYARNNESIMTTFDQTENFAEDYPTQSGSRAIQTNTAHLLRLNVSNNTNEIIGQLGERYVYHYLQKKYESCGESEKIKVVWLNEEYESRKPYDIVLNKNGQPIEFIEVKSTIKSHKRQFELSQQEFLAFQVLKEKYTIYRVFNTNRESEMRFEVLINPSHLMEIGLMKLTPRQYDIEYQPNSRVLLSNASDV
jgi:sacsin